VTLSMAVTKRMEWPQAVQYILAQCVGATLGGLAIWGVFAHKVQDAGVGHVAYAADTSIGSAMLNEGLGTAILLFTVLGIVDKRGGADLLAGLVIGLIVVGIIITVGAQTGAAINPARFTGTLITAQLAGLNPDWGQAWVYWVADIAGGLAGVFAYDFLATPRKVAYGRPAVEPPADVAESAA
jgi:glycerol uptake facilitator protein